MDYDYQPCPVCGHHMHEGEDIVICPDCATPHHRSCWKESGHCANEKLHESGFTWSPDKGAQEETEQANAQDISDINPPEEEITIADSQCVYCGAENDDGAKFCSNCGAPLGQTMQFTKVNNPFSSSTGMNPEEKIGEYTVDDLSLYTRASAPKLLPKFKKIEGGKKVGFNFWSFLFAPYWFFYRKLYKAGAVMIVLFALITLVTTGAKQKCSDIIEPYQEAISQSDITEEELQSVTTTAVTGIAQRVGPTIGAMLILNIILRVVCALSSDYIYYSKIKSDFEIINTQIRDNNLRRAVIAKRGGTSILSFICSYFLSECVVSLMIYISSFFAG